MAQPHVSGRARAESAQVLVFFALALPLVLLPVAAYAVDASAVASTYSRLVEVSERAAEDAAQQIDVARLRGGGGIAIDVISATSHARTVLSSAEPAARLEHVSVSAGELNLATAEMVTLPFNLFGAPGVRVSTTVVARIAPGYDSPSSLLPLPLNTF